MRLLLQKNNFGSILDQKHNNYFYSISKFKWFVTTFRIAVIFKNSQFSLYGVQILNLHINLQINETSTTKK